MYNDKLFISSLYINQIMLNYRNYMGLFIKLLRNEDNIEKVNKEYEKLNKLSNKMKKFYSVIDYKSFESNLDSIVRQTELNIFIRNAKKIHMIYDEFEKTRLNSMDLVIKFYNEENNNDAIK